MPTVDRLFEEGSADRPPRVLIVAELGVNHDGDAARAVELTRAAAEVGADAVKLQWFDPDRLLSTQALLAGYQADSAEDAEALLAPLRLGMDEMRQVRAAATEAGLRFIITPFSPSDVEPLAELEPDAVKVASPDAVNPPLLEAVRRLNRPLLVSTGASELEELAPAAEVLAEHDPGGCLLQCVSSYPAPWACAGLGGIVALRERFGLTVGYSDHTTERHTGALAVAAGAVVLEKHLTYDTAAAGPDHATSLAPAGLAEYVRLVREAERAMGPRHKWVLDIERDVRQIARQSVCATRDLPADHVLTEADMTVKRPGTGVPAAELSGLVGRRLRQAVAANHLLTPAHLA